MRDLPCLCKKPLSPFTPSLLAKEEEKKRTEELFPHVDLEVDALIVQGIGLGSLFKRASFLMEHAYFFVIEEDREEIEKFSSTEVASSFFSHPRAFLFHLFSSLQLEEVLRAIAWKIGFGSYQILSYNPNHTETFKIIQRQFPSIHREVELTVADYADLGEESYKNCYRNYLQSDTVFSFTPWKDSCKNLPAIICGGGESLSRAITQIDASKALIFAGGESLKELSYKGVPIQMAATMDPRASTEKVKGVLPDLPVLFQGRSNPDHFSYLENQRIYLPCNRHHPIEQWLWEEEYLLDAGWNVGNTILAAALYMGCAPIILVGQDLAFSEEGYYGKGTALPEEKIETVDHAGRKIYTKKDFIQARDWIAKKGIEYPNRIFISEESGLSKGEGIALFPLEKLKEYPSRDWKSFIHRPDLMKNLSLSREQKRGRLQKLYDSLSRCIEKCKTMVDSSLSIIEPLDHEIGHMLIVKPFWDVWHWSIEKEVEKEKEFSSWKMALHQLLFFQELSEQHRQILTEVLTDEL